MFPPRRMALPPRADDIFVNRDGPLSVFRKAVSAVPVDRAAICVFYGISGQGKTALCRKFYRLASNATDPLYSFLRCAQIDLHGRPKSDPDLLLVWIRNSFARAGIAFPAFDLALAIAWEASRGEQPFPILTNAWLAKTQEAIGELGSDAVQTVRSLVEESAETIPGLGALVHRVSHWTFDKTKRAYLERTRDFLKELYRDGKLKEPHELSELLPWMLAQDLNHHIAEHTDERLVLLIDEYERVFEEGGAGARWRENPFDRHLRTFVIETNGLLAVIFSREKLPWGKDPDWAAALEDSHHGLAGLAKKDAEAWLEAVPIEDEEVRSAMVATSREASGEDGAIYPLLIHLQIEHWRALVAKEADISPESFHLKAKTFKGRCEEIVEELLRDYGNELRITLKRLSVASRFDRDAFAHVVTTFGTGLPLDAFDDIAKLSFVSESEDGFLSPHRALAEAMETTLSGERRQTSMNALRSHFEARASVVSIRDITSQTITALVEAAYLHRKLDTGDYVTWLFETTHPALSAGHYAVFEGLWQEALSAVEDLQGADHPDTAVGLNNFAYCLQAQGRHSEAEPLYRRSLEIRERVLGAEHPDTALSLNNVAYCLNAQGRLDEAEPLYRKALEIRERVLGADHSDTATSLNNVALGLHAKGRYDEAEPLLRRALAIKEREFGAEHHETAPYLNNVAYCLNAQGRFDEAERLYRKAFEIRERVLGPDRPDTAASLSNIASNFDDQGRHDEAEPFYRRALAIRERVLGSDHPETAESLNDLAHHLRAQAGYAEAVPLYQKALAAKERVLGMDHPDTAASLNNVALNLNAQGRYGEAEPLYRRALELRERILGTDHLDTAISLNNLALNLENQGRYEEAEPLYRKALDIKGRVLEADHPSTATSLNNVAYCINAQGRHGEAEPLHRKALEIRERGLGPNHPDTAASFNNLACCLDDQGHHDQAEPLYRRALAVTERALGVNHLQTAFCLSNVAYCLDNQGRYDEAEPLYRRALAIRERGLGSNHPDTHMVKKLVRIEITTYYHR